MDPTVDSVAPRAVELITNALPAAATGTGVMLVLGPILVAVGLVGWLVLTWRGMAGTKREVPPGVPAPDRGSPVKGGFFEYEPGTFSHMRPPEER